MVQFDYAPDYKYYVSDITRVFPANGKFTARQREFYTIYLRFYQALMKSIRPGVSIPEVIKDAGMKMDAIITSSNSPTRRSRSGDAIRGALPVGAPHRRSGPRSVWKSTT